MSENKSLYNELLLHAEWNLDLFCDDSVFICYADGLVIYSKEYDIFSRNGRTVIEYNIYLKES